MELGTVKVPVLAFVSVLLVSVLLVTEQAFSSCSLPL